MLEKMKGEYSSFSMQEAAGRRQEKELCQYLAESDFSVPVSSANINATFS